MPGDQSNLAVRRHDRHKCDLAATCEIDGDHAQQVVIAESVADGANSSFGLRVVDCSDGGLGFRSPIYLPSGAHLVVDVDVGGEDGAKMLLRVQRVAMVDRAPGYYLGTSLVGEDQDKQALHRVIDAARRPAGAEGDAA